MAALGKLGGAITAAGPFTAPGETDVTQALGGTLETVHRERAVTVLLRRQTCWLNAVQTSAAVHVPNAHACSLLSWSLQSYLLVASLT